MKHLARSEAVGTVNAHELEELLGETVAAAISAWPDVHLDRDVFVARIANHLSGDAVVTEWLRHVRAPDLYLATACAERVPNAIETFDREYLAAVPAILARGGVRDVAADEVQQRVRERLFVGASKIADYSGRGSLASWIQVVVLRLAIDMVREAQARPIPAEPAKLEESDLASTDPELSLIKERYRGPFKQALRDSVAELTSEQRNLLKLHFVDGFTLDKLATLFNVHRATVTRRIAQARESAFDGVKRRLQAELGIDAKEFEELVDILRSRLELSLSALKPESS